MWPKNGEHSIGARKKLLFAEDLLKNKNTPTKILTPQQDVENGDVLLTKRGIGVVRYLGKLDGKKDSYIGVELEQPKGKHDGTWEGKRYFKSKANHGAFVKSQHCRLIPSCEILQKLQTTLKTLNEQYRLNSDSPAIIKRLKAEKHSLQKRLDGVTASFESRLTSLLEENRRLQKSNAILRSLEAKSDDARKRDPAKMFALSKDTWADSVSTIGSLFDLHEKTPDVDDSPRAEEKAIEEEENMVEAWQSVKVKLQVISKIKKLIAKASSNLNRSGVHKRNRFDELGEIRNILQATDLQESEVKKFREKVEEKRQLLGTVKLFEDQVKANEAVAIWEGLLARLDAVNQLKIVIKNEGTFDKSGLVTWNSIKKKMDLLRKIRGILDDIDRVAGDEESQSETDMSLQLPYTQSTNDESQISDSFYTESLLNDSQTEYYEEESYSDEKEYETKESDSDFDGTVSTLTPSLLSVPDRVKAASDTQDAAHSPELGPSTFYPVGAVHTRTRSQPIIKSDMRPASPAGLENLDFLGHTRPLSCDSIVLPDASQSGTGTLTITDDEAVSRGEEPLTFMEGIDEIIALVECDEVDQACLLDSLEVVFPHHTVTFRFLIKEGRIDRPELVEYFTLPDGTGDVDTIMDVVRALDEFSQSHLEDPTEDSLDVEAKDPSKYPPMKRPRVPSSWDSQASNLSKRTSV